MVSAAGHVPCGLSKRVCRNAKAQDFVLRVSRFQPAACQRQLLTKMAIALHWGINLFVRRERTERRTRGPNVSTSGWRLLASGESLGNLVAQIGKFPLRFTQAIAHRCVQGCNTGEI